MMRSSIQCDAGVLLQLRPVDGIGHNDFTIRALSNNESSLKRGFVKTARGKFHFHTFVNPNLDPSDIF